jgi:hypothetical protein
MHNYLGYTLFAALRQNRAPKHLWDVHLFLRFRRKNK